MSVVKINAIDVSPADAAELERRFADRAGEVDEMEGFEGFELLRPSDDRTVYLVYTRWRSEDDFRRWVESDAFTRGHRERNSGPPLAMTSELWSFEVAERRTVAG